MNITYSEGILAAFHHVMTKYDEVFVIGQGLWSPWYVGTSMTDLDKSYGKERVIDCPVSEQCTTGLGVGAAISGLRPIVVHPRMDFMILATDQIVNQAAKWNHMLGGGNHVPLTIRGIINRGGEQGAQHSQALHAWFAHIPGLRVVMPATPKDARDLLVASVLCDDPVLYIDDRWLYEVEDEVPEIEEVELGTLRPAVLRAGSDVSLVGCGYTTNLCLQAAEVLSEKGVSAEVLDLRVLNPLHTDGIVDSVAKTGHLCVVDGGWQTCGMGGEVIASVAECLPVGGNGMRAARLSLPDAPAPTSKALEEIYYPTAAHVVTAVSELCSKT